MRTPFSRFKGSGDSVCWSSRLEVSMRMAAGVLCLALVAGCAPAAPQDTAYAATIPPLALILQELCGDHAEVRHLLRAGASPHTYEPRPSDARAVEQARAFFYVAEDLDGWAATFTARRTLRVADWVPEAMRLSWSDNDHAHEHADFNTHFWSDPLVVRAMLPAFVAALSEVDPEGAPLYEANAADFAERLDELDTTLRELFTPVAGAAVAQFHPSWDYFLVRYGIEIAGVIEPFAGKEASPQYLHRLVQTLESRGVKAVLTEPQLPRRPAEVVADAGGWPLFEIDPIGGAPGRETYADLLLYNAKVLRGALE